MRAITFTAIGRILLALSFLALLGAWWTQSSGATLVGMSQQHLFNDAIALALLGIAGLLDGVVHRQAHE